MSDSLERPREAATPSFARGLVFRIGFVYWTLFCLIIVVSNISPLDELLQPVADALWRAFAWIGQHVFQIEGDILTATTGSGDRTVDWIWLLCIVIVAVVSGVLWAVLDRRRARDGELREMLRILMRYTLGFTMLGYGISKVFVLQFPAPAPSRLMQSFGDASPMGLLWTFMGASPAYVFLSGAAETLGAMLVLFRRTTLLGTLVLAGVLVNVVMLNFCYDVCVKMISSQYLAMAIYLALPDAARLTNVVLLNRAAQPRAQDLSLPRRWWIAGRIVKLAAIAGLLIWMTVSLGARYVESHRPPAAQPWYAGVWEVTSFHRDGREVPASRTTTGRWKRLRFQIDGSTVYARWRTFDAQSLGALYLASIDEHAQTFSFTVAPDNDAPLVQERVTLAYQRIDSDHLAIDTTVGGAHLEVELERTPEGATLLTTRGFHLVNEVPFNR